MWNVIMDEFTFNRYCVMRTLIREAGVKDKVLLDLGAGADPITSDIHCRHCILLDIRKDCKPSVVCNFFEGIPLSDNSVDVVIAGEILEHIAHSRSFLQEVRRVLKHRGVLILSVPNIVSLKYRIAFVLGRIPALAAKADHTYPADSPTVQWGHVRDYSFTEMRRVIADHGFRVVAERSIGMHWKGRQVVPPWLMPVTFSDSVIVSAVLCK